MPVPMPAQGLQMEDDAKSPEVMLAFYRRLFPYKPFFLWLNQEHVPSRLFTHREFAFTLGESTYVRYNSFNNVEDFKKEILRANPTRFEIGPIYNVRPRDRKSVPQHVLRPELRELVFDIDMTDYDEVRTCCSGGNICRRCWGFIAAAVKVLDQSLRESFGFKHLLWVYSGRRGIHCWISDRHALSLTDDQRRSLVQFLEVVKGGKEVAKKVNVRNGNDIGPLNANIEHALDTIKADFVRIALMDQNCFAEEKGTETLLTLLSVDRDTADSWRRKWSSSGVSSMDKWQEIMSYGAKLMKAGANSAAFRKFSNSTEDLILQYMYPRIDAEVSKRRNHLLKSPFVIHPGTGRVCVPVEVSKVDDFEPTAVPTVGQLLRELDRPAGNVAVKGEDGQDEARKLEHDYERTSLKPYIDLFEKHVSAVMRDNREAKKVVQDSKVSLDF
ncbi:hypothetical protein HD553DRAFT_296901 [Filobasidium floriforme]|uniref:uncharacterized protein n=1 Tax=Filobasidium floriforme TaxID=5210 RepID=UPI001E8EB0DD|nr:uncharacterized protein HD553DRAFT_296901 [Filobasidium floriforme]KAH8083529.1 hypothetical protein HD553DRAFT_296901 [Filobasidium floriforme]